MAAIFNSAMLDSDTTILDSDTLLSSLRIPQKHSHCTLALTQTNSIWLIWWWQPSWILSSWIQLFYTKLCLKLIQSDLNSFILTQHEDGNHLEFCHVGFSNFPQKNLTHSFWLNLMMAAILNSAMLDSDTAILDSDTLLSSLRFTQKHSHSTLTLNQTNSIWLTWWWQPSSILKFWIQPFCTKLWPKLIQSDSNSFILTQPDDGSHLEFGHLGFRHFALESFTHSFWLKLMMAAILNSAILNLAILDSAIIGCPLKLTHTCQDWFPPFAQKNFTHSFWLKLMMAAILNSVMLDWDTAIFDSDTLLSSLRFTQKHSHSTLTLNQTNSIWLTWRWQPSWILPSWILPSRIEPFCTKSFTHSFW